MKLVIAVISPDKLDMVRNALPEPDAYIFYVNLVGDVREPVHGSYRGSSYLEPRSRLRVEIIVVNEMLLDEVVHAVVLAASPESDDRSSGGNIFVMPLDNWIRIPDGNSNPAPHREMKGRVVLARGGWVGTRT
jgi:nitrogen regulatory protein PII